MRIDAYSTINKVYEAKPNYKGKTSGGYVAKDDKFEISDTAKSYSVAKNAVAKASDVRMDKVTDIKSRIAAGTYNVSADKVAEKILDDMDTISF